MKGEIEISRAGKFVTVGCKTEEQAKKLEIGFILFLAFYKDFGAE